jgi:hypothetical protein
MPDRVTRNRRFLTDLYAGPFPGHGLIFDAEPMPPHPLGDYSTSDAPIRFWVPYFVEQYERRALLLEQLDHDDVPYVNLNTHTGVFAAAFGCLMHHFEGSLDAAMPIVSTDEEADRLPQPTLDSPSLARYFELADLVRERVGPGVPIGGPDYQSPFDIAALIWRKESLYLAIHDNPAAVKRLVAKCHKLLETFWHEMRRRVPECNVCHCPCVWAPPHLGCSLSEDEAGCMSTAMFDEFCLPPLVALSETFGGMFVHCCADADHQYESFLRIPNLRGMNRAFVRGPERAVEMFSGHAVLMNGFEDRFLDLARPETRYLFCLGYHPLDEAQRLLESVRERVARRSS